MAPPNVSRLPAFPDPDAQEKATIKAFWKAVDELQSQGAQLNHARDSTLIAVCLKHFLAEAKKRKVQVPSRVALLKALPHSKSPAYQSTKAVNSAIQSGSVYCWVFRAPEEAPAGDQPPLFEEPT